MSDTVLNEKEKAAVGDAEGEVGVLDQGADSTGHEWATLENSASDEGVGSTEDRPLHVDIPDECKQPKLWFREEPPTEVVREIRDYVAEHGVSHTWSGHTHTRPPVGARVKYIGRFELPEKFQRLKQFLVCPICRPTSRNFGKRDGYIAWFPDEGVIRLIGPDCFAEINKEGHEDAVQELKDREKRKREISFLISQRDQHQLALTVLIASRRVAQAVDNFGFDLRRRLYETLNVDVWSHVRTGVLEVEQRLSDPRRPGKFLYTLQRYGSLKGYRLLDPKAKKLEPMFAPHIDFLRDALSISDEEWSTTVNNLDDGARGVYVKKLGKALDAARDLRGEVSDVRSFIAPDNLGTLRSWGSRRTEGSPIGIYARRDGTTLRVGGSEDRNMPVQIPPDLELDIPSVAELTAKKP